MRPPIIFLFTLLLVRIQATAQAADQLKLKDFQPVSIYQIPESSIDKARYPVVDFHSHDYPKTNAGVDAWVHTMDRCGIAKTMILSYQTGPGFDSVVEKYARYKNRFVVWCGIDYTGCDRPGWSRRAIAELERCHAKGAAGVGELGDKGLGELYSRPTPGTGIHVDDPRLGAFFEKCADLHMPVSIHVAEDAWMYLDPDSTNDGLMNAATWHVDTHVPGKLNHDQLLKTLENVVGQHPRTLFIACHLANCCANLAALGKLLDRYPNLYADIAARYGEIAPIPRYAKAFLEHYADRIVYGTDMGDAEKMYHVTFRILESTDEHFYCHDYFSYHWPLYGLGLSDMALHKIYTENAMNILESHH